MKLTFRTRKTGLMANPQSKNKSRAACEIEVVVQCSTNGCKIQSAPQQWSHDGVCMAGYPHRCIPHETITKTSAKPWVAWSQVSRFGTTGNRVLSVCTRTKKTGAAFQPWSKFKRVGSRLAKSRFEKARPRMRCCQPCRQSRSRRVLFTVANLI